MRTYKLQIHQNLNEYVLKKIDADFTFLSRLIFSDESTFHLVDFVERHNWSVQILQKSRRNPKINMWIVISIIFRR